MKKFIYYLNLSLILFAVMATLTGCDDDEDSIDRSQFVGTYSVAENCDGQTDAYTMTVSTSSSDDNGILIDNLFDVGGEITATVSGSNITIPQQTVDGVAYNGSGSISGNVLTINFNVEFLFSFSCTATATK